MKQQLQITFFLLFSTLVMSAQAEKIYAIQIQKELGGKVEQSMPDGSRADLVTHKTAFEIDFAAKWKESIGQALWYALQSNKRAGIILIRQTKADYRYVQQLYSALEYAELTSKFTVLIFPDDFPNTANFVKDHIVSNYWLSKNSKKRHNKECYNYNNTNGYYCGPRDGSAAGCCGG